MANENPLVIENREELLFLLGEASQLEHMLMCEYLFAVFSLKRDVSEGITAEQLEEEPHVVITSQELVPEPEEFATVGHLYRGIERGFQHLVEKQGEQQIFIGPPRAQATQQYFAWAELVAVTDLNSAIQAIETIVEEGEGARGAWQQAHYGKFLQVYNEYQALKQQDPNFEPTRPVRPAFVRQPADTGPVDLISDPVTAGVSNLFNASYATLLSILNRFFLHGGETDEEFKVLSDVSVDMMFNVIRPVGMLLTTLPICPV